VDTLPGDAPDPDVFYEFDATADAVWERLSDATVAHFSCHGRFEAETPLESGLHLARGTRLTLGHLLDGPDELEHLRLVVLSACQTAITEFQDLPDEAIGLPAGLLQAGVPGVVGALWPVNDLSTALLMGRFYELHLRGDEDDGMGPQPAARALRLAQMWLRYLTYRDLDEYAEKHWRRKSGRESSEETAAGAGARM
jgi:CHAT domain-containing protein